MYQYSIKFEIRIPNTVAVRIYFESKLSKFFFFFFFFFFFLLVKINSLLVKDVDR